MSLVPLLNGNALGYRASWFQTCPPLFFLLNLFLTSIDQAQIKKRQLWLMEKKRIA